jgi:hypothetical protein
MSWLAVRRIVLVDGSAVGPVLLLPFARGARRVSGKEITTSDSDGTRRSVEMHNERDRMPGMADTVYRLNHADGPTHQRRNGQAQMAAIE